eukprot:scaffold202659_cov17-Prasinocladus_malaysianus.AAC.1
MPERSLIIWQHDACGQRRLAWASCLGLVCLCRKIMEIGSLEICCDVFTPQKCTCCPLSAAI